MTEKKVDIDQMLIDEWRRLGFFYDFDDRLSINQWRFYGSKQGLHYFGQLLEDYAHNPNNNKVSEHQHYGPYSYLKIITIEDQSIITENAIGGTIAELRKLKTIIWDKLKNAKAGQTFNIDKDFGDNNTATAKFFIMADGFDPVSMDDLIISRRQFLVNEQNKK